MGWFEDAARDLPWRRNPTPYRVLLSELMLQQTRVDTVIPYFDRFVSRWPTLEDLAAASEEDVLREWAGLGYYNRARRLHAIAISWRDHGIPRTATGLRALPGIGAYTAGAIASIAFGERVPAVDGNVQRVISRLRGIDTPVERVRGKRAIEAAVTAMLAHAEPSELNQALMELGATVCTPKRPSCPSCPWRVGCVAADSGTPEALPVKAPRRPPTPIRGVAGVLWSGDTVFLGQRQPGLLGGLWEPISALHGDDTDPVAALLAVYEACGVPVSPVRRLGSVVHVFSHRRLTLEVWEVTPAAVRGTAGPGPYQQVRRVVLGPEHLERGARPPVPLSTLARKTLALSPRMSLRGLPLLLAAEGSEPS